MSHHSYPERFYTQGAMMRATFVPLKGEPWPAAAGSLTTRAGSPISCGVLVRSRPMTQDPTNPSSYAAMIRHHYQSFLPKHLAEIPASAQDSYFLNLGEEMADLVESLELSLRGPDPAEENFMTRLGRFNMARLQAQEAARAQFLPAPDSAEPEEPNLITHGYWDSGPIPTRFDPSHPWWIAERQRLREEVQDEAWMQEWETAHPDPDPGSDPPARTT